MPSHRSWSPSWMAYHSSLASLESVAWSRCARSSFTALASAVDSSERRRHRDRRSPTAGPPSTRTISAVDPPSSETGMTCVTLLVRVMSSWTTPLNAVPPVKHTSLGSASPSPAFCTAAASRVPDPERLPSPARGLAEVLSPSVTSATIASAPVVFGSTARRPSATLPRRAQGRKRALVLCGSTRRDPPRTDTAGVACLPEEEATPADILSSPMAPRAVAVDIRPCLCCGSYSAPYLLIFGILDTFDGAKKTKRTRNT